MSPHMHCEQEEVHLVLDGTAMIGIDGEQPKVGEREALAVPARATAARNVSCGSASSTSGAPRSS
jgi:uncharacterized cupin superfamily protein